MQKQNEMYQRYLHKTPSIEEPEFSSEDALVILQNYILKSNETRLPSDL